LDSLPKRQTPFVYFLLKTKNEALVKENELLKNTLEHYIKQEALGSFVKIDTTQYSYIAARVIRNSYAKRNNILTLNKGEADGVKPNMGVVLSDGYARPMTKSLLFIVLIEKSLCHCLGLDEKIFVSKL